MSERPLHLSQIDGVTPARKDAQIVVAVIRDVISRTKVKGSERLAEFKRMRVETGKGGVVISNHLAHPDGPIIKKFMNKNGIEHLVAIAAKGLEANPFTAFLSRSVDKISVIRDYYSEAYGSSPDNIDDLDELGLIQWKKRVKSSIKSVVESGNDLLVFPETTRSRESKMKKFKKGSRFYFLDPDQAIQPLSISRTEIILPPHTILPRRIRGKVNLEVIEPFIVWQRREELGYQPFEAHSEAENEQVALAMAHHTALEIADRLPSNYRGAYSTVTHAEIREEFAVHS